MADGQRTAFIVKNLPTIVKGLKKVVEWFKRRREKKKPEGEQ